MALCIVLIAAQIELLGRPHQWWSISSARRRASIAHDLSGSRNALTDAEFVAVVYPIADAWTQLSRISPPPEDGRRGKSHSDRNSSVAHRATFDGVTTTITQRELRNSSGDIMRRLDEGETFIVTRAGKPVGELSPLRRERFITAETVAALFHRASKIDADRFRADLDEVADPGIDPRA